MCDDCGEGLVILPTGNKGDKGDRGGLSVISTSLITDINTPYIPVSSVGYSTISTLAIPGSTALGSTPSKIKVIYLVDGGTATIRVLDNNSNLIATNSGTSSTKAILTLNITASASTLAGGSFWELQVLTGGVYTAQLYAWSIY